MVDEQLEYILYILDGNKKKYDQTVETMDYVSAFTPRNH